MKNLNQISDSELLTTVKAKAENERQLTLEVINLLREIQFRRLHLKRGYSSLHEFCVKELKYSDGAAFRRIKAMKLVEDIPEVVSSIRTGSLSLSTASQLQKTFETKLKQKAPLNKNEKIELIKLVQQQSRREAERTIAKVCPEAIHSTERARMLNESKVRLELVIEEELYKKIEKLKNLTSHKNRNIIELVEELVDNELKRHDLKPKTTASPAKTNLRVPGESEAKTRHIPSSVKHFVRMRDKGQCTYVDPMTKRKCESKYRLTFEHIQPFSLGGKHSPDNLRILCANHNALTAIHVFGETKMNSFA